MTDDLKATIRSLKPLGRRADTAALKLAAYGAQGGMIANNRAMATIAQLATSAREFDRATEEAIAGLSEDLGKALQ
jgi:hypothetical protein